MTATLPYEDIETLIPNTAMRKVYINGIFKLYEITPIEGYYLHDNTGDMIKIDEETGEEYVAKLRYKTQPSTVPVSYSFTTKEMTAEGMTVTDYGNRELFALPASDIPEDSTYSEDNKPETA